MLVISTTPTKISLCSLSLNSWCSPWIRGGLVPSLFQSIGKGVKNLGEIAYLTATRSNGSTVVIIAPSYTEVENVSGAWTVSGLENAHPQFSGTATLFVRDNEVKEWAMAAGWRNIIVIEPYCLAGDRWTFENGSYMIFSYESEFDTCRVELFNADNERLFNHGVSQSNKKGTFTMPSYTAINGNYYGLFPYFFNTITFEFIGGKLPYIMNYSLHNFFAGIIGDSDPLSPAGTSGSGGGKGTFSGTGDSISIPSLPTLGATSAGFITLFNPTISQLNALASYMWSTSLFDVNTWQKLWADPMQAILGLSLVPVQVPNGGPKVVKVGNIPTNVSMTTAATQYVEVDCGTLSVQEYWGAYLDYDPYTKAEIYLPYIGTHALAVDDIMGKSVHVVYHVDILSGACCAYVKCGSSVLYTFIGQCSSSIPISGADFTNVINGVLTAGVSIGSMVATGGATAPMAVPSLASTAVNGLKPNVEKSGAMAGTGGMMGIQTPFLILTRPRQALPESQNSFTGYPAFITETLGNLTGYTEIEAMHLENIPATESELTEIENLLKSGVIF